MLFRGLGGTCNVGVREAFRPALVVGVPNVAFIHNHPSGDTTPSQDDQRIFARLDEAADLLGIHLVDHLIVGTEGIYSEREGKLPPPTLLG